MVFQMQLMLQGSVLCCTIEVELPHSVCCFCFLGREATKTAVQQNEIEQDQFETNLRGTL